MIRIFSFKLALLRSVKFTPSQRKIPNFVHQEKLTGNILLSMVESGDKSRNQVGFLNTYLVNNVNAIY